MTAAGTKIKLSHAFSFGRDNKINTTWYSCNYLFLSNATTLPTNPVLPPRLHYPLPPPLSV